MSKILIANTTKRLITANSMESKILLRQRFAPGVTELDKAEWDKLKKLKFVQAHLEAGHLSDSAADTKRSKEVNKAAAEKDDK